jgi:hypothetical protein
MVVQSFSDKSLVAKLYTLPLVLAMLFLPEQPADIEDLAGSGLTRREVVNKL